MYAIRVRPILKNYKDVSVKFVCISSYFPL